MRNFYLTKQHGGKRENSSKKARQKRAYTLTSTPYVFTDEQRQTSLLRRSALKQFRHAMHRAYGRNGKRWIDDGPDLTIEQVYETLFVTKRLTDSAGNVFDIPAKRHSELVAAYLLLELERGSK